jgi:hypothetical protein
VATAAVLLLDSGKDDLSFLKSDFLQEAPRTISSSRLNVSLGVFIKWGIGFLRLCQTPQCLMTQNYCM